jgi:hypothetical protein
VAVNGAGVTYGDDMSFKTKKDDNYCFIQTAASGFSPVQPGTLPMPSAHKTLLLIVMFGLVAGACIQGLRFKMEKEHGRS